MEMTLSPSVVKLRINYTYRVHNLGEKTLYIELLFCIARIIEKMILLSHGVAMVGLWYGMTLRTLIRSDKPGRNSIVMLLFTCTSTLNSENDQTFYVPT